MSDEYEPGVYYLIAGISTKQFAAIEKLLAFGDHYREEIPGIEIVEEWVADTRENIRKALEYEDIKGALDE